MPIKLPALPPEWSEQLKNSNFFVRWEQIENKIDEETRSGKLVFPAKEFRMRALLETDFDAVKVVIFGQDPYHKKGQATGLCFAVPHSYHPKPPSLKNIMKEMESDLKQKLSSDFSDLAHLPPQGVLLLNTLLSVEEGKPLSHENYGWQELTTLIIEKLNRRDAPIVFVLLGAHAQKLKKHLSNPIHIILEETHPSPLSAYRGFLGSKIFTKINHALARIGLKEIAWVK